MSRDEQRDRRRRRLANRTRDKRRSGVVKANRTNRWMCPHIEAQEGQA